MENKNITNSITNSINTLFTNLHKSLDDGMFKILDEITFINNDILNRKYFSGLLNDKVSGLIILANALLLAVLIYFGISYLFSRFSITKSYQSPLQFISKFIICAILINSSDFILDQILYIIGIITDCVRNIGISIFSFNVSFTFLSEELNKVFLSETFPMVNVFTFEGIIHTFLYYGFINLLFTYSLRYIFLNIFILLFPFAILSFALDSTSWILKMWLKNFFSLLLVQVVVSIILMITMSLKYSYSDSTVKILYIGCLFALLKANSFMREFFSGFATDISNGINSMKNLLG